MSLVPRGAPAWGKASVWLKLPGFNACFSGLSSVQQENIAEDYCAYSPSLKAANGSDDLATLICETYRLDKPIGVPIHRLERDGQYTPIRLRNEQLVDITGLNFRSYFSCRFGSTNWASLGVMLEDELAQSIVLENFLRIYSAYNASARSGVILHSAGLVFDQQAYVFAGHSGAGKTTLTRKAHRYGATVLSDDLNLILPSDTGYDAYKVPFTGEFGKTVNQAETAWSFPVKAVLLLDKATNIKSELCTRVSAVSKLLACSPFVNTDEHEITALFDIYGDLIDRVPVIKLSVAYDSNIDEILSSVNEQIDSI